MRSLTSAVQKRWILNRGDEVLSLVVPAYNEAHRIGPTLQAYIEFLRDMTEPFELIVICDGCTDGTEDVVRAYSGTRLITYPERLGKGGGVRAGFLHANGDVLAFVDADNSLDPVQFSKLIVAIDGGADAAIASRHVPGSEITVQEPPFQRFASRVFNLLVRLLFQIPFHDTQCGGKAFRASAYRTVESQIVNTGFEFDVEVIWRLHRGGFDIAEVPVKWGYEEGARFSVLQAPRMFMGLMRARFYARRRENNEGFS